jgi:hypothetical protein
MEPSMKAFLAVYAALAVFFGFALAERLGRYPVGWPVAVALYLALLWLVGLMLLPGFAATRAWAERLRPRVVTLFVLPYLFYALGTGDFRLTSLLKVFALVAVPVIIYQAAPAGGSRIRVADGLVLLSLGLPVFLGWIHRIWTVPVNLDFLTRLLLLGVGAWSFVIFRGLDDTGYEFRVLWRTVRDALVNFAGFSVIAMPLGLALGFIRWNPDWRGPWPFLFDFLTIFLFIALPEELFFRGALQNLLEGTWGSRRRAQAVASVIFGFGHILHAPRPNWKYVILASIAGWFYGSAYRGTRSLMASATTHALVDTVWRTWFRLR